MAYPVSETRSGSNPARPLPRRITPCAACPSSRSRCSRSLPCLRVRPPRKARSTPATPPQRPRGRASPRGALRRRAAAAAARSSEAAAVTRSNDRELRVRTPEVTAAVGETITWTNSDSAPTYRDDRTTGRATPGTSPRTRPAGLVFDAAGTYTYHCNDPPEHDGLDHDPVAIRPVRASLRFSAPR